MPSATRDKRATSPKERIIPIEIEGNKSKTKAKPVVIHHDPSASSDAESVIVRDVSTDHYAKNTQSRWEVKVVEPKKQNKAKPLKDESKAKSKKDPKKKSNKKSVDVNENPVEKKKKSDKPKDKKGVNDSNGPKENKEKTKVDHEISNVTITTQPSKSILKHPIASSTPIPEADYESSWANRSTASTGTVVKKPASLKKKCWTWCCLPCSLCCVCAPFEVECCDCCLCRCTRCEQCFCSFCNRKCC